MRHDRDPTQTVHATELAEFAADQRKNLICALTGVAFSSEDRSAAAYVAAAWPNDHFAAIIAKAAVTPISTSSGLPSSWL